MAELPPGPWHAVRDEGRVNGILDAGDELVIDVSHPDGWLVISPEVLRAVEALPVLVAAARRVLAAKGTNFLDPHVRDMIALEEALALVDGPSQGVIE